MPIAALQDFINDLKKYSAKGNTLLNALEQLAAEEKEKKLSELVLLQSALRETRKKIIECQRDLAKKRTSTNPFLNMLRENYAILIEEFNNSKKLPLFYQRIAQTYDEMNFPAVDPKESEKKLTAVEEFKKIYNPLFSQNLKAQIDIDKICAQIMLFFWKIQSLDNLLIDPKHPFQHSQRKNSMEISLTISHALFKQSAIPYSSNNELVCMLYIVSLDLYALRFLQLLVKTSVEKRKLVLQNMTQLARELQLENENSLAQLSKLFSALLKPEILLLSENTEGINRLITSLMAQANLEFVNLAEIRKRSGDKVTSIKVQQFEDVIHQTLIAFQFPKVLEEIVLAYLAISLIESQEEEQITLPVLLTPLSLDLLPRHHPAADHSEVEQALSSQRRKSY